jgi:hypothetical protein
MADGNLDENNVYLQLYRFKTDRTVDHATEHLPPLNRQVRRSAAGLAGSDTSTCV